MDLKQIKLINDFVKDAKFFLVKLDASNSGDIGKVLRGEELMKVDLKKHEVYRSIDFKNDNVLFVYDLKSTEGKFVKNPLLLLKENLIEARVIESVYPDTFTWVFDGLSIKAYAVVPSGINAAHSTLSRYGGTYKFINILRQHISNIGKMVRGISPNYSFLKMTKDIEESELCIGSINLLTNLTSIAIDINDAYMTIINKSLSKESEDINLKLLNMKFWSKEINPDFVVESKNFSLEKILPLEMAYVLYPEPIKNLMALRHKGYDNRDLIARFLLSIHTNSDAKHVYYSVLSDDELDEVKKVGSNQWNYSVNNYKKYGCPSNDELKEFITKDYKLSHPLEKIQEYFDSLEVGDLDD